MTKSSSLPFQLDSAALVRELAALAAPFGLDIGPAEGALVRFAELVMLWGRKTDLVAATNTAQLAEVVYQDAFALAAAARELGAESFIDVGAGAGAPAIPLALLLPRARGVLLEPRRRRVTFMRTAVGALKLGERVRVLEGRLGEDGAVEGAPFDLAFSRATFAPDEWARRGAALAPAVGLLISRAEVPPKSETMFEHSYAVPSNGALRRLVVIRGAARGS